MVSEALFLKAALAALGAAAVVKSFRGVKLKIHQVQDYKKRRHGYDSSG